MFEIPKTKNRFVFGIRISDLPALLSRFSVTSGATDHNPSEKSKIVTFGRNYLTG
jgi:hypothetical protein